MYRRGGGNGHFDIPILKITMMVLEVEIGKPWFEMI